MNIQIEITIEIAIFTVALAVSFSIFLYYYLYKFKRVTGYKFCKKGAEEYMRATPDISVVVVIGDDIEYIEKGLPLLINQKYEGNFNIVVVHDSPESDTSISMLDIIAAENENVYLTRIKKDGKFKHTPKLPITVGIKAAKYPNILFTDRTAYVSSDKWISYMASGFISDKTLVIGATHTPRLKGVLNRFTRSIEITDSLLALSYAIDGRPYSVQSLANMGYTSRLFFDCGGFRDHLRYNSGNGDLFIQRLEPEIEATSVIMHPKASMAYRKEYSGPLSWYSKRKFDTYSRRYYPLSVRTHIATLITSSLIFWVSTVMLILQNELYLSIAVGIIALLKMTIMARRAHKYATRVALKVPYITFLLSDLFIFFDYLILSIIRRLKPNKSLWL